MDRLRRIDPFIWILVGMTSAAGCIGGLITYWVFEGGDT